MTKHIVGINLWSQASSWPDFLAAAKRVDALGYDSLWTWDHLHAIVGDPQQAIFEGYVTLGAWAASTKHVQLGLMVGANTFRNPGLVVKSITTLDHASGGRAILGIGGAWFDLMDHNKSENAGNVPHLLGTPAEVAAELRPFVELGFRTIIVRLPAPFDRPTIDRMPEVAALLADA
jgi:alkanesulfonate monooxygenase SsuD/methylene tetrahydromethanopterin reductase-like flavin-dependent oxidoreductase (luciferase family)